MPDEKYIVLGFNLKGYATDPNQPVTVAEIAHHFQAICYPLAPNINSYIQKRAPGSPVTGEMCVEALEKYAIGTNGLAVAIGLMQNDSMFGTKGEGSRTHNPGNVGNWDNYTKVTDWESWDKGVEAVFRWLFNHKADA